MTETPKMYFYHLTNEKSAQQILKSGLKPRIGFRSFLMREKRPYIYLTDEKSIPYWEILLDRHVLLKIDANCLKYNYELIDYRYYKELVYDLTIPAQYIQRVNKIPCLTQEQKTDFQLFFIDNISTVCFHFANYTAYYKTNPKYAMIHYRNTQNYIQNLKHILRRIDFTNMQKNTLEQHLQSKTNRREMTLCDYYEHNKNQKLWEILEHHELATKKTIWLHRWLENTFPTDYLSIATY